MSIVFLDTETTGTDPDRHEVWEIGLVVRDHRRGDWNGEWLWQLPVDLTKADPAALRIGRYYERISCLVGSLAWLSVHPKDAKPDDEIGKLRRDPTPRGVASLLARLLDGVVIAAANPTFDTAFLQAFLRRNGHVGAWDYHLLDIGSMGHSYQAGFSKGYEDAIQLFREMHESFEHAELCGALRALEKPDRAGYVERTPPMRLDDLVNEMKIEVSDEDRHTALGDARFVRDLYDAMIKADQ